jgi:hypothetical protein
LGLVYGTGTEGAYYITCDSRNDDSSEAFHLHYDTSEKLAFSDQPLLDDPFVFLHKPPGGGLPRFLGTDIYTKIAWHLYRIAVGEVGPYREYIPEQAVALKRIAKKNPDATDRVREKLTMGDKT